MPHEFSDYKGNAMIILSRNENDKYPFQFGAGKARLILDNLAAIQEFVKKEDAKKEASNF